MNTDIDGQWHADETIRADKVSVGVARDAITGENAGVLAMFTVPVVSGEPMHVSVVMSADQTITFANALLSVALDIGGVDCVSGDMP